MTTGNMSLDNSVNKTGLKNTAESGSIAIICAPVSPKYAQIAYFQHILPIAVSQMAYGGQKNIEFTQDRREHSRWWI